MITFEIEGLKAVQKALRRRAISLEEALMLALHSKGLAIMGDSVRICPVKTSRLLNSRYVAPPKDMEVRLGYGTNYALAVHEMPANTNWTKKGAMNKYLSRAYDKHRRGFAKWIKRSALQFIRHR